MQYITNMNVTLPIAKQLWGDDAFLCVKEYGVATAMSDFAVWIGAMLGRSSTTSDGRRSGRYVTASANAFGYVRVADSDGGKYSHYPISRYHGVRLALPPSSILNRPGEIKPTRKIGKLQVYELGEYPQGYKENVQAALKAAYDSRILHPTGKIYTIDGEELYQYKKPYKPIELTEYGYHGKRYICAAAKPADGDSILSNGKKVVKGEIGWFETEPIEWFRETAGKWKDWMLTVTGLAGGIKFDEKEKYDGVLENTVTGKWVDNNFAYEMMTRQMIIQMLLNPETSRFIQHHVQHRLYGR